MKTKLSLLIVMLSFSVFYKPCTGQNGIPHQVVIPPSGQNVRPHPVPVYYQSPSYDIQYVVNVNGMDVPVFHAGLNVYFASFDFTGTVDVKVTAGKEKNEPSTDEKYIGQTFWKFPNVLKAEEFWEGKAQVRPLSKNISCQTQGTDVSFSISEPGQYTVERPGTSNYLDRALFLFANAPETKRPKPGDANVIYLEPGLHHRNIDLSSGQTLYMEAGAVLFGAINVWDARDVKILGRGTVLYYGPQSEDFDDHAVTNDFRGNLKNWHPLTTRNTTGLTVEGITFIDRSRCQMVVMYNTYDVVYDNIKLISVTPQNIIGDGFQLHHGGGVNIKNSLIRSSDDCFSFYDHKSMDKTDPEVVKGNYFVKDYLIENCVIWGTLANVFRVGVVLSENIVMKDCDIIHFGKGKDVWSDHWSVLQIGMKSRAVNYRLENIRFEEYVPFLGLGSKEVQLQNIVFRDITMSGTEIPWDVRSKVDGMTFDNVKINGKLLTGRKDLPLKEGSTEIKNLSFK